MILYLILFVIGIVFGIIFDKVYEYHKSLREFEKRQERYRRMI